MNDKTEKTVESIGLNPVVSLVVVDEFGNVKLLEQVGESILASFLRAASKIEDNPIKEDSFLLDCRGQEVYVLECYDYFKSITGIFLSSPSSTKLPAICTNEGLRFSFIISY